MYRGKTSLAFQYAYGIAAMEQEVYYICNDQMKRKPLMPQQASLEKATLEHIHMMYVVKRLALTQVM
mgnify:CR=1 FL=1